MDDSTFDAIDAPTFRPEGLNEDLLNSTSDYFHIHGAIPSNASEAEEENGEVENVKMDEGKKMEENRVGDAIHKTPDMSMVPSSEEEPKPEVEVRQNPPLTDVGNVAVVQPLYSAPAVLPPQQLTEALQETGNLARLAMFGNQPKVKRRSQLRKEEMEKEQAGQSSSQVVSQPAPRAASRGRSPSVEIVGVRAAPHSARVVASGTPSQPPVRGTTSARSVPVRGRSPSIEVAARRAASPSVRSVSNNNRAPVAVNRSTPNARGRSPSVTIVGEVPARRAPSPSVTSSRKPPVTVTPSQPTRRSAVQQRGPVRVATAQSGTPRSVGPTSSGVRMQRASQGSPNVSGPITRSRSKEVGAVAAGTGDVAGLSAAVGALHLGGDSRQSRDRNRRTPGTPEVSKQPPVRKPIALANRGRSPLPSQEVFFNELSQRQSSLGRQPSSTPINRQKMTGPAPAAGAVKKPTARGPSSSTSSATGALSSVARASRPMVAAASRATPRAPVTVGARTSAARKSQPVHPRTSAVRAPVAPRSRLSQPTTGNRPAAAPVSTAPTSAARPRVDVAQLVNRLSQPRHPRQRQSTGQSAATPVRRVPLRHTHGIRSRSPKRNRTAPAGTSQPNGGAAAANPPTRRAPAPSEQPSAEVAGPSVTPPPEPAAPVQPTTNNIETEEREVTLE